MHNNMNESIAAVRSEDGAARTWEDHATGMLMRDPTDPEFPRAGQGMSNPFTAEMALLTSLTGERISSRKEGAASMPPPVPLESRGKKRRAVPPLNDHEVAMGEVQTLPAYGKMHLARSSTDHAGIKEMQIARKSKHEVAIAAYGKRVSQIEVELEVRTGHAGRGFKKLLTLNDEELQSMFDELGNEFLLEMELDEVNEAWERLQQQTDRRVGWINDFEAELQGIEQERRAMVEHELSRLMDSLVQTAHMLPPALERMCEAQVHDVNLLILSNREVHAQLMARVRRAEIIRQKEHRQEWEARLAAWRVLRHEQALQTFKAFLHSAEVVQPRARRAVLRDLVVQQADYQKQREESCATLAQLEPPHLTEAAARLVRDALEALIADEAMDCAATVVRMHEAEEEMREHVQSYYEHLIKRLYYFAAYDVDAIDRQVEKEVVPLLETRIAEANALINQVERSMVQQRRKLHESSLQLTAVFEGAGKLFDEHAARGAALYEAYRNQLAQRRAEHEVQDLELEMKLDQTLLGMRRAADKPELERLLGEALQLLVELQQAYRTFQSESVVIALQHPVSIANELKTLQANLLEFHSLLPYDAYTTKLEALAKAEEAAPAEAPVAEEAAAAADEAAAAEGAEGAPAPAPAVEAADVPEEENLWATFGFVYPEKMEAELRLEAELLGLQPKVVEDDFDPLKLFTDCGTAYRLLEPHQVAQLKEREEKAAGAEARAAAAAEATAAAEAAAAALVKGKGGKGKEPEPSPPEEPKPEPEPEVDSIAEMPMEERANELVATDFDNERCSAPIVGHQLTQDPALLLRLKLASTCLSYHERHAAALSNRAQLEAEATKAEVTLELDERLLAHRPRAGRIELDMFQERDVELLLHRERFVRHTKSVASRRAALEARLEQELRAAEAAMQAHLTKMSGLRMQLGNNKNNHTPTLLRLQREALAAHTTFVAAITERFERLQGGAAGLLKSVQAMNHEFDASWKLFTDGGNFNQTESERFRERLSKLDDAAAAAAAAQQERLQSAQESQMESADTARTEFLETLKLNLEDIALMEGLKLRQGKATAEMRIELSRSSMQHTAIDEQVEALKRLLPTRGSTPAAAAASSAAAAAAASRPGTADASRPGTADAMLSADDEGDGEEESEAKDPMGGQLSRQLLAAVDLLRKQLLERAKFLQVLKSTTIPTGAIDKALDPPLEGAEPVATDSGVRPELAALMPQIEQIRHKHEVELVSYCKAYYADKADREITRPNHIPASLDEHKVKLADILGGFVQKAAKERVEAVHELRLQLLVIVRVLNLVPPALFEDVTAGVRAAALKAAEAREEGTRSLFADLQRKRELHQHALKPSLRNPSSQPELLALEQAEASRSDTAIEAASKLRADLLASETAHGATALSRMLRCTEMLLQLFDATLMGDDLVPADEPPEDIHYGLKKKMRMEARAAAVGASNDEIPEGRPFPRHAWASLPLGELEPTAAGVVDPAAEAASPAGVEAEGGDEGGDEGAGGAETSEKLMSNFTRLHRTTATARDRVYAAYRMYYQQRVLELAKACDSTLSDERQWAHNWTKMVSMLKN